MGARQGDRLLQAESRNGLERATVSLVTDYSAAGRQTGQEVYNRLNSLVRRVTTMWAPAADLVRVATGHIDAVVAIDALYGDVCSGLLILAEAGGTVRSLRAAEPLEVASLDPLSPVSFVAAAADDIARALICSLQPVLAAATSR
jgi:myo-inositol-1(or 4)-monophosphatase